MQELDDTHALHLDLDIARTRVADAELELRTLSSVLAQVDSRHRSLIAVRYAEIEQLRAAIASERLARAPGDTARRFAYDSASARATRAQKDVDRTADELPALAQPSETLRSLYRRAARLAHPDLAETETDRVLRTELMSEINARYSARDLDGLLSLFRTLEARGLDASSTMSERTLLLEQLSRLNERLKTINAEIANLKATALGRLAEQVYLAAASGRDLLREMCVDLDRQILTLKRELTMARQS